MPPGSRRFWGALGYHRIYVNDEFAVNGVDNPTGAPAVHPYEVIIDAVQDTEGRALVDPPLRKPEGLRRLSADPERGGIVRRVDPLPRGGVVTRRA